jgi:hypothetical protein
LGKIVSLCNLSARRPSTPEKALDEIAKRIESGERLTLAEVEDSIRRAKRTTSGKKAEAGNNSTALTPVTTDAETSAEQRKALYAVPVTDASEVDADPLDDRDEEWAKVNTDINAVKIAVHAVNRLVPGGLVRFLDHLSPRQKNAIGFVIRRILDVDADAIVNAIMVLVKECVAHPEVHTDSFCENVALVKKLISGDDPKTSKTKPAKPAKTARHGASRRGIGKAGRAGQKFTTINMKPDGTDPSGNSYRQPPADCS